LENLVKRSPHNMDVQMSPQYGELRPLAAEIGSLGHPIYFNGFCVLAASRYSSSGRQPHFAALNRGLLLYLAGQPSHWALARILVCNIFIGKLDASLGVVMLMGECKGHSGLMHQS